MSDERAVLEEERAFLLQSLRTLDDELAAGDLAPEDYEALKDDYTVRAADVLRRIDALETPQPQPVVKPTPSSSNRLRRVVTVVVIAACAAGAGYAVAASSGARTATDEATGSIPLASTDRITRAQALVAEGKVLEAIKLYDELLAEDPENPVALAQRGWLVSRVDPSLVDSGLASVEKAIAEDPTYADARFFRGMILWRAKGQPALAAEEFQRALDTNPPPDVRGYLEQARQQALAEVPPG